MSAREDILLAIKFNRPPGQHNLPVVALYRSGCGYRPHPDVHDESRSDGRKAHGTGAGRRPPCVVARAVGGRRDGLLRRARDTRQLYDLATVDIAVVRACFGIAETGSVLFTEDELRVNALAYLAQHLVVLLDPEDIVASTQDAYRRSEFNVARYASFHTGPSATADIEGVLIHGAQGVRSLTVLMQPTAASMRQEA